MTFHAGHLPTIRHDPEPTSEGGVRLVQPAGGREGAPFPRPVPRAPFAQWPSPVLVAEAGSSLEHELSSDIMRGGHPSVRRLKEGEVLTRQGEPGDELYLVLDGMLDVDVDGTVLARIGPGAVLGERAILEAGLRTSTLTAATKVVVAVAPRSAIDLDRLAELATGHHREDA